MLNKGSDALPDDFRHASGAEFNIKVDSIKSYSTEPFCHIIKVTAKVDLISSI